MPVDNTNRHVSQFVQIGILSVILYYGMKWIVDNMDPTRKRRQLAQKEVSVDSLVKHNVLSFQSYLNLKKSSIH